VIQKGFFEKECLLVVQREMRDYAVFEAPIKGATKKNFRTSSQLEATFFLFALSFKINP
jgi:hypothetical protein